MFHRITIEQAKALSELGVPLYWGDAEDLILHGVSPMFDSTELYSASRYIADTIYRFGISIKVDAEEECTHKDH